MNSAENIHKFRRYAAAVISGPKKQEPLNTFELEHIVTALMQYADAPYPANEAPDMTLDLIDRFGTELAALRMKEAIEL